MASNVKAFAGERRKVKTQPKLQSFGLRVAPEIGPTVRCGQDFVPKRNPQLSLVYVFCFVSVRVLVYLYIVYIYIIIYIYIYLYIIYNIIKNKKKEPTHRVAHTHTEKTIYNNSCGLRFLSKSALQHAVDGILGATRNLQPATLVAF